MRQVQPSCQGGVAKSCALRIWPQTYGFGKSFEHFLITEIHRLNTYGQCDFKLSYLRTKDQAEIDLIIERPGAKTLLVEIKSKENVDERDIRNLEHFLKDFPQAESYVFSRDPREKKIQNTFCLPWNKGIQAIGL